MVTPEFYMKRCFELAEKGKFDVQPNPMVGAVLVKEGEIVGEGYHTKYGKPHAEVEAIQSALSNVEGATLYCNLEPCCHTNKQTPPCTELIIEKKIKKVIVSNLDPNPEVSGKGLERLKEAGIEIESGLLKEDGEHLNRVFFTFMTHKRPFIHLKAAQTLDGKICSLTGDSKWISSSACREEVHQLRRLYKAIGVGKGTLLSDNPKLNARDKEGREVASPLRVLFAKEEEVPSHFEVFKDPSKNYFTEKKEVIDVLKELYEKKVSSLLIEGGQGLLTSFFEQGLYDQVTLYIRPILLGNGQSVFKSERQTIDEALELDLIEWRRLDDHIIFEGKRRCLQD